MSVEIYPGHRICILYVLRLLADLLSLARPDIFDLSVRKLSFLYDEVIEVSRTFITSAEHQVDERITQYQSTVSPKLAVPQDDPSIITNTTTGEVIRVLSRPDPDVVKRQLDSLWNKGIKSIAIAFVHSYLWGEHEEMVAKIAEEMGFEVSVSSKLQPMVGFSSSTYLIAD